MLLDWFNSVLIGILASTALGPFLMMLVITSILSPSIATSLSVPGRCVVVSCSSVLYFDTTGCALIILGSNDLIKLYAAVVCGISLGISVVSPL